MGGAAIHTILLLSGLIAAAIFYRRAVLVEQFFVILKSKAVLRFLFVILAADLLLFAFYFVDVAIVVHFLVLSEHLAFFEFFLSFLSHRVVKHSVHVREFLIHLKVDIFLRRLVDLIDLLSVFNIIKQTSSRLVLLVRAVLEAEALFDLVLNPLEVAAIEVAEMGANIDVLPVVPTLVGLNVVHPYQVFLIVWESDRLKRPPFLVKFLLIFS